MANKSGMIAATAIVALLCVFLGRSFTLHSGATVLHRGPVQMIYWRDIGERVEGYTQGGEGLPGTSTVVKVKAYASIYADWVAVQLDEESAPQFIPRDRIVRLQFDRARPEPAPLPITH
jgi:hypothetical protein